MLLAVAVSKASEWVAEMSNKPEPTEARVKEILAEIIAAQKSGEDLAGIFTAKGVALALLDDEEASLSAHRNACKYGGESGMALFNMGVTLLRFNKPLEAYKALVEALAKHDGYNGGVLGNIARALCELGNYKEVRRVLPEAIRLATENPDNSTLRLAEIAATVGMHREAVDTLAVAVLAAQNRSLDSMSVVEFLTAEQEKVPGFPGEHLARSLAHVRAWGGKFGHLRAALNELPPPNPESKDLYNDIFEEMSGLRAEANAEAMKARS